VTGREWVELPTASHPDNRLPYDAELSPMPPIDYITALERQVKHGNLNEAELDALCSDRSAGQGGRFRPSLYVVR